MAINPYQYSVPVYGQGSKAVSGFSTNTPPGYTPGATQSTITNPGPGVSPPSSGSVWNSVLSGLQSALTSLSNYLSSYSSKGGVSGGSVSGGGVSGGSVSGGGVSGSGVSGGNVSAPKTTSGGAGGSPGVVNNYGGPPTVVNPNSLTSVNVPILGFSQSTPAIAASGLANELSYGGKKKTLNEQQVKIATQGGTNVPTRNSFLAGLINLVTNPNNNLNNTSTPPPGTTTTTRPENNLIGGVQKEPTSIFSTAFYNPMLIPKTDLTTGEKTTTTPATGGGTTPTEKGSNLTQSFSQDFQTLEFIKNRLIEIGNKLEEIKAQERTKTTEGGEGQEEGKGKQPDIYDTYLDEFRKRAQLMYDNYNTISAKLQDIDKIIANAMIGFRKTAEDIRNNPDLSVWQKAARLRELDDLQNYAPIFDGLSLKDLIAYRGQLADMLNHYADFYNRLTADFTDILKIKRQAASEELENKLRLFELNRQLMNSAREQIQQFITSKAIARMSDEDLQRYATAGGYTLSSLQAIRDSIAREAKIYSNIITRENANGDVTIIGITPQGETRVISVLKGVGTPSSSTSNQFKSPSIEVINRFRNAFIPYVKSQSITPEAWNAIKQQWITEGYSPTDFDKYIGKDFDYLLKENIPSFGRGST